MVRAHDRAERSLVMYNLGELNGILPRALVSRRQISKALLRDSVRNNVAVPNALSLLAGKT